MGPRQGYFVAVEGGDGAGKGGLVANLAAMLREDGRDVLATREPGGTPEGLQLRALLLAASGQVWEQNAELLLMVAARVQHVRRIIQPALAAGKIVVCDRFIGSTLAYQGAGRGLPEDLILDLHARLVDDIWPDLTILLDVDPRIGLDRSLRRLATEANDEGRFESLDMGFHDRVRRSFRAQAESRPSQSLVIDASQAISEVHAEVAAGIRSRLGQTQTPQTP